MLAWLLVCCWCFAVSPQQCVFSALPPRQSPRSGDVSELLTKKLSEIENEQVENWIRAQLEDLEYSDVADAHNH